MESKGSRKSNDSAASAPGAGEPSANGSAAEQGGKAEAGKEQQVRDGKAELERQEREAELARLRAEVADLTGKLQRANEELTSLTGKLEAAEAEIERQRVALNKIRVGALEVPANAAQLTESVTLTESLRNVRVDGKLGDVIVRGGSPDEVRDLQARYGKQYRVYAVSPEEFDEVVRANLAQPGA